jgi:hypothetical protein
LELTDDTWPRKDEYTQRMPRKQQSTRYVLIQKKTSFFGYYVFEYFNLNCLCYSRAIVGVPLQPLDARSLLAARAVLQTVSQREKSIASSTPPSSLDLEWEHEGMSPVLLFPLHQASCVKW